VEIAFFAMKGFVGVQKMMEKCHLQAEIVKGEFRVDTISIEFMTGEYFKEFLSKRY
jgi:hypothetical protein